MTRQTINYGTAPNDGTGDPLRDAMHKSDDNFAELYNDQVVMFRRPGDPYWVQTVGDYSQDLTVLYDIETAEPLVDQLPHEDLLVLVRFHWSLSCNNAVGSREMGLYFYLANSPRDVSTLYSQDLCLAREQVASGSNELFEDYIDRWVPVFWTGSAMLAYARFQLVSGTGHLIRDAAVYGYRKMPS